MEQCISGLVSDQKEGLQAINKVPAVDLCSDVFEAVQGSQELLHGGAVR